MIISVFFLTGCSNDDENKNDLNHEKTKYSIVDMPNSDISNNDILWPLGENEIEAKQSTVEEPLSLNDWGYAGCFGDYHEQILNLVHIDAIYNGEDAEKIIKQYKGRKTSLNPGTSFVVVEYSTTKSSVDLYLNLRVCGLDGNRIMVDGKSYTTRTYDLDGTEEMQFDYNYVVYGNRYAYYEIPDGCNEYLLQFGERVKGADIPNANFLIKVE